MRRGGDGPLFAKWDVSNVIRNQGRELSHEIEALSDAQVLNTRLDQWCDYFEEKYRIEVPVLHEDRIETDERESNIDVSGEPGWHPRSGPNYAKASTIDFFVPFSGDAAVFYCTPSRWKLNPPAGMVDENERTLRLSFVRFNEDADHIRAEFDGALAEIRENLMQLGQDVAGFNAALRDGARAQLTARHGKRLADYERAAALGFRMRRRDGAPSTYAVPAVKRNVAPARPPASSSRPPEPALGVEEYDHILGVIRSMVHVMERSPAAFRTMREEDLRQHFLVQLNGHYEGQATGETFNYEGKTDILIRWKDCNIFIAECKFWQGPVAFTNAIDQLLGYTSWRDTKTALLIFNQNKDLSAVAAKIGEEVASHPNFVRHLPSRSSETEWCVVLRHRDDPARELWLTVLLFDMPR